MPSFSLAPYAWSYELANVMNPDGSYGHWSQPVLSFTEPNVPEGSIRNLTPLYVRAALTEQPASQQALTDEQIDRINCEMWASCPLDLPQGRMFARAIERAHGIGAAPAAPAQEPQQPLTMSMFASRVDYDAAVAAASPAPAVQPEAVAELVEALRALVDRNFTFFDGGMIGADRKITRDEVLAARTLTAKHGQPQGGQG